MGAGLCSRVRGAYQAADEFGDGQGHIGHPLRRSRGGDHERQHRPDKAAGLHVFIRPRGSRRRPVRARAGFYQPRVVQHYEVHRGHGHGVSGRHGLAFGLRAFGDLFYLPAGSPAPSADTQVGDDPPPAHPCYAVQARGNHGQQGAAGILRAAEGQIKNEKGKMKNEK